MSKPSNKVGRPPAVIDLATVERCAEIGCTVEEIAAVLGIAESTLHSHMANDPSVKATIDRGRGNGKHSLRRMQWQGVQAGNPTMLIWLGKQMLGQRDHKELTGPNGGPIDIRNLSTDQLIALLATQAVEEDDGHDPGGTGTPET